MSKFHGWVVFAVATVMSALIYVYGDFFGFYLEEISNKTVDGKEVSNLDSIRAAWGQFGDFFGGVLNPILGFVSLILILHSLKQNKDALAQGADALHLSKVALELNAQELRLSRDEAKRAADALEANRENLNAQYVLMRDNSRKDDLFKFSSMLISSIDSWNGEKASDKKSNIDEMKSLMSSVDDGYYHHALRYLSIDADAKYRLGLILKSLASVVWEMQEMKVPDVVISSLQSMCTMHAEMAWFLEYIDEETAKALYPEARNISALMNEELVN